MQVNIVICKVLQYASPNSAMHGKEVNGFIQGHTENVEEIKDPREVVETYRRSMQLAKKAGFDGVELLAQG